MRMVWFRCPKCNHEFEEVVKRTDEEIFCPKCGALAHYLEDFIKQIHRKGNHYNHVSWSVHHAGE